MDILDRIIIVLMIFGLLGLHVLHITSPTGHSQAPESQPKPAIYTDKEYVTFMRDGVCYVAAPGEVTRKVGCE